MKFIWILTLCLSIWRSDVSATKAKNNVANRDDKLFPVSIIHINDFHARFEETNEQSTNCKQGEKCIGGLARATTVIKQLMRARKNTNPIYLNAGDNFQGTFWYTVGRWNVTSYFLNKLKADAITLGNHEFDHGIAGVVPFMETIESPIVVSNIDDSDEPTFQGKYKKSTVIDRYGRKIGVIGVILSTTNEIANTEKLKFLNESIAIRNEAAKLKAQGVDIIIVLSHCGLDVDYIIAKNAGPDVDVIVGGHSHTFMYTAAAGVRPPGPDVPRDNYPAVVTHEDGHRVLIVQASCYTKYVGDITVYFDTKGRVVSWEGKPIFLDTDIEQDPEIVEELKPWQRVMEEQGNRIVGIAKVPLQKSGCNEVECNLGNVIADAFVHYFATAVQSPAGKWTTAPIAVVPANGLRTTVPKGQIIYSDLITTIPFENTIDAVDLSGEHLKELLEYSMSTSWSPDYWSAKYMVHVSGLKVVYNITNPKNERIVSLDVLSTNANRPQYEPLDPSKYYRVIVPSFLITGGDGFYVIPKNMKNHEIGPIDIDAVVNYFKYNKPVLTGTYGRITVLK